MGAASSSPLLLALDGLLRSKGLEVKHSTLQRFLQKIDIAAPWFAFSGSLTVPSWDKLGKDLDFASEQGILEGGVIPLWKMVRSCLTDGRCQEALTKGQAVLEQLHEEKSETAGSEVPQEDGSVRSVKQGRRRLYPDLSTLRTPPCESGSEEEEDEEEELGRLSRQLESLAIGEGNRNKQGLKKSDPPDPLPYGGGVSGRAFHAQTWRAVNAEMGLAYPVFQDDNMGRFHEPLDFKIVKTLVESVRTYGVDAAFTLTQVESLSRYCMTPSDWASLVRACVSPGKYLDWRAFVLEGAIEQAAQNHAAGHPHWDKDMLLGQVDLQINRQDFLLRHIIKLTTFAFGHGSRFQIEERCLVI
ncbi:uncharacterized protein LOC131424311 [Marmota monax]|uniref:uncharacterized protein LOC131424311 n=1 Tax=Marmota monax TaxID=9995 RepID=UPI0026ECF047|nr:uncharacterized protein LOC131424311 [Marmota monax]